MRAKKPHIRIKVRADEPAGRLDATPERLSHARASGQAAMRDGERLRRIVDPFDVLRAHRALAPHDTRVNDTRWLTGEALRRLHQRGGFDQLRAVTPDRIGVSGFGPRSGLPATEAALLARDKLHAAAGLAGPAAWPILTRIVIEGGAVRDCRAFVAEVTAEWRVDAIIMDRLRWSLDALGALLGVIGGRR
jgi:hypothetical protein